MLLYENGYATDNKSIVIAAVSDHQTKRSCGRVVRQMQSVLGHLAGFSLPYMSATSGITKIEYVTAQVLLWEMMIDPLLERRSVVVVEHSEDRHLWMDAVLGILYKVLPHRTDLKLILSLSAGSIEFANDIFNYFNKTLPGKTNLVNFGIEDAKMPVETYFLDNPTSNYLQKVIEILFKICGEIEGTGDQEEGDVLVIVPTKKDVQQVIQKCENDLQAKEIVFMPLFNISNPNQYQEILGNDYVGNGIWRVIVTTGVIDGDYELFSMGRIQYVIDSGYRQIVETNFEAELVRKSFVPISVEKAEARRLMASNSRKVGKCYRVYTHIFASQEMAKGDFPETFYTDLTEFSLCLQNFMIPDLSQFQFLAPAPPIESLKLAIQKLYYLRAVDTDFKITMHGRRMADSHLPVKLASAVAAAADLGCVEELITIAAMVLAGGTDSVFFDPSGREERKRAKAEHAKFQVKEGDFLTLLNVYEEFKAHPTTKWTKDKYLNYRTLLRAKGIRAELHEYLNSQGIVPLDKELGKSKRFIENRICLSICKGFFLNSAKRSARPDDSEEGIYFTLINSRVNEDDDSTSVMAHFTSVQDIESPWIVYDQLVETQNNTDPNGAPVWCLKGITAVQSEWLLETGFYKIPK